MSKNKRGVNRLLKISQMLVLVLALVFLLGLSGCGGGEETNGTQQDQNQTTDESQQEQTTNQEENGTEETTTPSGDNLLTIDANTVDSQQREKYDFAKQKAKQWHDNARLVAVQVEVPSSLKKEESSARFVFSSPSVNFYYWTIAISADSTNYLRALIPKEDYLSQNLDIILDNYWEINYCQALQIADQNGGSSWRESNNLGMAKLTLSRGQPNNYHYWQVEYVAVDKNGIKKPEKNFKIKIAAYDGEVVTN